MTKLFMRVVFFSIAIAMFFGCAEKPQTHMVKHVSRILTDKGDSYYYIYYDDGAYDKLLMHESYAAMFSNEREYHRNMNTALWDQAWEETRNTTNSWQAFKDRYVELGGTMLFD